MTDGMDLKEIDQLSLSNLCSKAVNFGKEWSAKHKLGPDLGFCL